MNAHRLLAVCAVVLALVIVACGARSTLNAGGGSKASGGSSSVNNGGGGSTNDGGGGGIAGQGGLGGGGMGGEGGEGGIGGGPGECVVFNSNAALAPADLFMMMDKSGSMDFPIANGQLKWTAVTDALDTFFADMESAGMDASLAFFPIINTNITDYCFTDTDCGAPASCFPRKICPLSQNLCTDDSDCETPGDTCQDLGRCDSLFGNFCVQSGDGGFQCPGGQTCRSVGGCDNRFTCEPGPYQVSQSGLVSLPSGAAALSSLLDQQQRTGATPTLPALTGIIQAAIANISAQPTHKSFVVLVTDGLPTVCDPDLYGGNPAQAIDNLRAAAAAGFANEVQTFVIGVFAPDEEVEGTANLNLIAAAGGTTEAFIISTMSNVSAELLTAMNDVRAQIQACEFELITGGDPVNFNEVWVRLFPDGEPPVWVEYVGSAAGCDPVTGGFYYDNPPPATPSRVILCQASCDVLLATEDPVVEVFTSCDPTDDPMP